MTVVFGWISWYSLANRTRLRVIRLVLPRTTPVISLRWKLERYVPVKYQKLQIVDPARSPAVLRLYENHRTLEEVSLGEFSILTLQVEPGRRYGLDEVFWSLGAYSTCVLILRLLVLIVRFVA